MRPPKILPWLARQAHLPLDQGEASWHASVADSHIDAAHGPVESAHWEQLMALVHSRLSMAATPLGCGATTWLAPQPNRLLEDGRIEFEGISGARAGAMNAAVLADGYGREMVQRNISVDIRHLWHQNNNWCSAAIPLLIPRLSC